MGSMIRFIVLIAVMLPSMAFGWTPDVDLVRKIKAYEPRFIAVDESGNIYTTQWFGPIKIFDPAGNVIREIPAKTPDGKRAFKRPVGITLHEDLVYVTDESLGAVVLFTRDGEYVTTYGQSGNGPKEFREPHGITIAKDIIYVADTGNGRVQMLSSNGVYIGEFGNRGDEKLRLKAPTDIAFLPNGDIAVADNKGRDVKIYDYRRELKSIQSRVGFPYALQAVNDGYLVSDDRFMRVVRFNTEGGLVYSFGSEGFGTGQFPSMNGIFLARDGTLYIADPEGEAIYLYKLKDTTVPGPVSSPPPTSVRWVRDLDAKVGRIAWDQKNKVMYAIDEKGRSILKLSDGEVVQTFEVKGWNPSGMALGPDGALWVSDLSSDRILRMNPEGEVVLEVGTPGSGPGRLDDPADIVINSKGVIFVADRNNERVQMFNTDGVFLNVLGRGGTSTFFERPDALALDEEGILYVLDTKRREVLVFSPDGLPLSEVGMDMYGKPYMDEPVDLTVTSDEIFVLDAGLGQVLVFNVQGDLLGSFGSPGHGKGDFDEPISVEVTGIGLFYVSDTGNGRLQEIEVLYTPDYPRNIIAEPGMRAVELKWKPVPGAYVEKYIVYRSSSKAGSFEKIGETARPFYKDTDREPDKPQYYQVSAVALRGTESHMSVVAEATPKKYRPYPPSGVEAEPGEHSVSLKWFESKEPYVSSYRVYRQALDGTITTIGETKETVMIDKGLAPNTPFTYIVAAVSTDGIESKALPVHVTTLLATKPPLEIEVIELKDVFSNTYKIYENEGMGRIRLINNTSDRISKITVLYSMKDFMDFPSEIEVRELAPDSSFEYVLKPVFNDRILDVTEDAPMQTEIRATYYYAGKPMEMSTNRTVNVYEKHRMTWDVEDRIATFVTPKDAIVLEFARTVATQYRETGDPLVLGGMLFDSLSVAGMTYLPDPTNPYQVTSGKTDFIDYIQYPRETLKRNSGDCDDLVSMYAASLESLGIQTRILFYPGHMFMMFSIGFISESGDDDLDGMLVRHDGRVWLPVELTLVGSSFISAWERGNEGYNEWKDKGLQILDLRDAWVRFKPASLPDSPWRSGTVVRERVTARFAGDYRTLKRIRLRLMTHSYAEALRENPQDVNAMLQAGIIYAEAGETVDAIRFFERGLLVETENAAFLNNIGNVHFMEKRFKESCDAYERAGSADPNDAHIWVNLARCRMKLGELDRASEAFRKAYEIDDSVSQKYRSLSFRLMGTF